MITGGWFFLILKMIPFERGFGLSTPGASVFRRLTQFAASSSVPMNSEL
jgi:hypothetical protein